MRESSGLEGTPAWKYWETAVPGERERRWEGGSGSGLWSPQTHVQTHTYKVLQGQVLWGQKDCGDITEQQAVMSPRDALWSQHPHCSALGAGRAWPSQSRAWTPAECVCEAWRLAEHLSWVLGCALGTAGSSSHCPSLRPSLAFPIL